MTDDDQLPNSDAISCGLYRTTEPLGDEIEAGRLVYYHNHGEPGPGVYLPENWRNNRALFRDRGVTLPDELYATTLEPLLPEGLYRVREPFYCCEQRCQYFDEEMLVQLGYNGEAEPILFVPEMVDGALALPAEGTLVGQPQLGKLAQLKIPAGDGPDEASTVH